MPNQKRDLSGLLSKSHAGLLNGKKVPPIKQVRISSGSGKTAVVNDSMVKYAESLIKPQAGQGKTPKQKPQSKASHGTGTVHVNAYDRKPPRSK